MVFNTSIRYHNATLFIDEIEAESIVGDVETPVYIYSLKRILDNLQRLEQAFAPLDAQIHYSAKANSSGAILRALIEAGAGIDAVSAGEIYRALAAGAKAKDIVFAGAGKTRAEILYAIEQGVGWINVENVLELEYIHAAADALGLRGVQVALRFNPLVTANTHPYISTGHGGAKFGLTEGAIDNILTNAKRFPRIDFSGVHMHIGSQLGDTSATMQALEKLLALIQPYPQISTINLGGGLPVAYHFDAMIPSLEDFARALAPRLKGYRILLEPGRSLVADAGILVTTVLYVKRQAGKLFYIVDASMAELIRPALYQAHHEVVPLVESEAEVEVAQIVGPVCETADILAVDRELPRLEVGDRLAVMTTGAYGMAMASNYNSRLRPAEVVVGATGDSWWISRQRETLQNLLLLES